MIALKMLWTRVRCWWHCLTRMHRSETATLGTEKQGVHKLILMRIRCNDCNKVFYVNKNIELWHLWKELNPDKPEKWFF
jgi:hypothetical protein